MLVQAPKSSYAAKGDGDWLPIQQEIDALPSLAALEAYFANLLVTRGRSLPPAFIGAAQDRLELRRQELTTEAKNRSLDHAFLSAMERDR